MPVDVLLSLCHKVGGMQVRDCGYDDGMCYVHLCVFAAVFGLVLGCL